MKPRITPADQQPYARVAALPVGTTFTVEGKRAAFVGMTGNLITIKLGRRNVLLRAGDPRIAGVPLPMGRAVANAVKAALNGNHGDGVER